MSLFLSCDWGTSAFRLRLVERSNAQVLTEIKTHDGIASIHEAWKQSKTERILFYQAYLIEQVKKITATFQFSFADTPIVISGMISSSIGMLELPYKMLPFKCDGTDLRTQDIQSVVDDVPCKLIIISGAQSSTDVMRGEETMLVGCGEQSEAEEQLFIFPGTHSKHVWVKKGIACDFATYMTGELFELLSKKSILAGSVQGTESNHDTTEHFIHGVLKGSSSNLMNSLFHVRTNQLFKKLTVYENFEYLSGLLIGHELQDIAARTPTAITLVCSESLKNQYLQALKALELSRNLNFKNADAALISGQLRILQRSQN